MPRQVTAGDILPRARVNSDDCGGSGSPLIDLPEVEPEKALRGKWSDRHWQARWMGRFLDGLALLPVVASAARAAGVSRQHAYRMAGRCPEFAAAWDEAQLQGVELVEEQAIRWATVGIPRTTVTTKRTAAGEVVEETTVTTRELSAALAMFILRRHKPEFRDRHLDKQSGSGGSSTGHDVEEKLNAAAERFSDRVVQLAVTREAEDSRRSADEP